MAFGPYPADVPEARPVAVVTALQGNTLTHTTDPLARKVTVHVHAPEGGPDRARPLINGSPVRGSSTGPYVFEAPPGWTVPPVRVDTRAGNNDIVVVEEF
jgi:hypothetical protein